jgi:hypothetical protein
MNTLIISSRKLAYCRKSLLWSTRFSDKTEQNVY